MFIGITLNLALWYQLLTIDCDRRQFEDFFKTVKEEDKWVYDSKLRKDAFLQQIDVLKYYAWSECKDFRKRLYECNSNNECFALPEDCDLPYKAINIIEQLLFMYEQNIYFRYHITLKCPFYTRNRYNWKEVSPYFFNFKK